MNGDSAVPALVSVVMPAFKPHFLAQALDSIAAQTHRPLELVVCDDSADGRIEQMVAEFAARADFPVQYSRNPERLWETRSTARAIAMANGEFIKFLHDDDVLEPDCVAALLAALRAAPRATLAATRRRLIDARGEPMADELATAFPSHDDVRIDGNDLVAFLADHTINFIGEPSAVMCRRAPLAAMGEDLPVLAGTRITWVADLALYVKLLRDGELVMLARPRVRFRISRAQFSQLGRDRPGIGEHAHDAFRRALRAMGWQGSEPDATQVRMAALGSEALQPVDMLQALSQALQVGQARWQLVDWQARRVLPRSQYPILRARLEVEAVPRLGILVVGDDADAARRTVASLASEAALYANTSIRVLGASTGIAMHQPPVADWHSSEADALADWEVDWILRVDAGTCFLGAGRMALLFALWDAGEASALYVDGWLRQADGQAQPVLRPDFNHDLLLHHPGLMARHWVFRREQLLAAGGYGPGPLPELAPVLALVRAGLAAKVVHLAEPALEFDALPVDDEGWRAALQSHLRVAGQRDAEIHALGAGLYRIDYRHQRAPRVSMVIVAGGSLPPLQRCVISLLEKTDWPDIELLLLDNGGCNADTQAWLSELAAIGDPRVQVFAVGEPQPASAARNLAAAQASGDLLLFLDPGIAALQSSWLRELVNHALREDVGIVGARTIAADGTLTHAGVLPGVLPGAGRAFLGEPLQATGYLQRLQIAQDYSAVAGHCLMIERALFEQIGGFDAGAFADEGADLDLCLRVRAGGLRVVWTPHALLLHGDVPDALPEAARDALFARWLPQLARDPAYHPALRLDVAGGFRLDESEFSWQPLPWKPLPRVLAHPDDAYGSGHYRVMQPLLALREAGHIDGSFNARLLDVVEMARLDPDVVVWQRRIGEDQLALMDRVGRFHRAFKVYELDDYLPNLPLKSAHRAHMPRDVLKSLRRALSKVDRFVVSTPAMAEAFAGLHPDIRVAPNRLPPKMWDALPQSRRNAGARPRVGWAGGLGHAGDLEMIADVVRALAGEVDWVFFGLCPDALRPYVAEFHPGVDIERYPRVLARLDLDLALAPLEDNRFNACKSALRLLEYGACGFPVVCSDIEAYRVDLPVTRVKPRHRDWLSAIREHLSDADARAAAGDALRQAVHRDWRLAGEGLEDWRAAWMP